MTKEEILKYIMQSPENTNPAVLEGMLEELGGGSSEGIVKYNTVTIKNISDESFEFYLENLINDGIVWHNSENNLTTILGNTETSFNFITSKDSSGFMIFIEFSTNEGNTISISTNITPSQESGWFLDDQYNYAKTLIYQNEDTPLIDQNLVVTVNVQGPPK